MLLSKSPEFIAQALIKMSVVLVDGKQMSYKTYARMHKTCKQAKGLASVSGWVYKLYMYMACDRQLFVISANTKMEKKIKQSCLIWKVKYKKGNILDSLQSVAQSQI